MIQVLSVVLLALLAGCSAIPSAQTAGSPCVASEASYECQVERYQNVNVQ